jgi:hypothetical protein
VRGIKTKLRTWNTNLSLSEHDVVAATETFLDESIMDTEVVYGDRCVIRRDRGSWGGGVLITARSGISLQRRSHLETVSGEDLWTVIAINGLTVFLCVVYIPPSAKDSVYLEWFFKVESFINDLNDPVLIVGDINMNSASQNIRTNYNYFMTFCNLCDQNNILNSFGGKLDIVLTRECVDTVKVMNSEFGGIVRVDPYHPPLDIEAIFKGNTRNERLQPSNINGLKDWNFNKVDFASLSNCIGNVDWSVVLQSDNVINVSFYHIFNTSLDRLVPKQNRPKFSSSRFPVWFDADLIKDIGLKTRLHRRWKRSYCQVSYINFSILRASLKVRISSACTSYIDRLENNLQRYPRHFWRHINGLRCNGGFEPSVKYKGHQKSGVDAANAFASQFSSVYTGALPLPAPSLSRDSNVGTCINIDDFSITDVRRAIEQLKPSRSSGPDGIPADILRTCKGSLSVPLCHIMNFIRKSGVYPPSWKISRVTPIPKNSNRLFVEEYRPIAILSAVAKVFEIVLHGALYKQVQPYFCNEQHGFRRGRSVTTNLLTFVEHVSHVMDGGGQVDVIYFDFRKAFDRVDCNILVRKLDNFGFSPGLVELFRDYLRDRHQFVRYGCYVSESYPTPSGVTQGSILGPLLFLIMINDIVTVLDHSKCLLYADDLKLFAHVRDENDCRLIQRDINALHTWSLVNGMQFNHDKCNVMTFSRSRRPIVYDYELGGVGVSRTNVVKDLGVTFDSALTFNEHIMAITKSCFSRLGFVLRNLRDFHNPKVMKLLYVSLVRSTLETNACVWCPHEAKYKLMLEKVQKAFLRFYYRRLHGYYPFLYPTNFLLGALEMNSLEVRRTRLEIVTATKILQGHIDSPEYVERLSRLYVPDNYLRIRTGRRHQLFSRPACRTETRAQSPLCRMHDALNTLLANYPNIDVFIDDVKRFLYEIDYVP